MGHWYLEFWTGSRSFQPACWHKLYHTPTRRSINSTYYVLLPSTPLAIDFAVTKACAYDPCTRPRCFRCSFKASEQLTRQISLPLPITSIPPLPSPLPTNPPSPSPPPSKPPKAHPHPPNQPTPTYPSNHQTTKGSNRTRQRLLNNQLFG